MVTHDGGSDPDDDGERFRTAFESAPTATLLLDADGRVTDANRAARDLLPVPPDGRALSALAEGARSAVDRARTDGSGRAVVALGDGTDAELTVRRDESGRLLGYLEADGSSTPDEREAHLEAVARNMPVVLFALDETGRFTLSRGRGLERLGLEPGELDGTSVFDAYADEPSILRACERALDGEAVRTTQELGETVFQTHYRPTVDEGGAVTGVIGVSLDVTEHVERERTLDTLLSTVPAGVFMADGDGELRYTNETARTLLDADDDPTGRTLRAVTPAGHAEGFPEQREAALADGDPIERRHVVGTGDDERTVRATIAPVDPAGGSDRVVGITRDVTDRVERERRLRENDAILEQLTATTDDVFWLFDGAFEETRFVNEAHEDVWGQSTARLREDPSSFIEGVHPEDREAVRERIAAVSDGRSVETEFRVNPREGFGRWVSVHADPVVEDGTVERVAGITRDVTDRVARERRLAESNERLERFAYVASHDLQEPLRTISNYVELIEEEYADALDEEGRRLVDVVVTGSERMQSMIDGLLDYSRVTTQGEEFAPVDVERVVADVIDDLSLLIEEHDGTVRYGDLPTVRADGSQLRQLVQNLVKNALEHSADDEPVEIEVRATETEGGRRFAVADDGPGIEPGRQEKVFRMFKSSERYNTSSQAKGIGLAVCENIVGRHGGTIDVDSTPGEGATFEFTIPERETGDAAGTPDGPATDVPTTDDP